MDVLTTIPFDFLVEVRLCPLFSFCGGGGGCSFGGVCLFVVVVVVVVVVAFARLS